MSDVREPVQRQVEAYNARDIDRFCACYAQDIEVYRMPALEPAIVGQQKFREAYIQRFKATNLHAEILTRVAMGSKVVDHERVVGIKEHPVEVLAVYEVDAGLIRKVWFFAS